ncbi:hypothetical protein AVEN_175896-1 [Araneus ventricosus]|uniref:Uncharacterized protein n=1 Tax=Araneus ventricosus TaxID=182803 RepID=A0A4Y2EC38_ARAVE|nr:hypothetical protein AVEN_175896-1 [Araneus ventricosus]
MPFGTVNPIDFPYGQFLFNYVALDTSHAGQDDLTEARTGVRSIMLPIGARYALPSTYTHSTDREPLGFRARGSFNGRVGDTMCLFLFGWLCNHLIYAVVYHLPSGIESGYSGDTT